MPSSQEQRYTKELRQRNKDGLRGYPVASVAYFGSDDQIATKVAVFILPDETFKSSATERWQSVISDLRNDEGRPSPRPGAHHRASDQLGCYPELSPPSSKPAIRST